MPRDRRALIGSGIWDEPSVRHLTPYQQRCYLLAYTQRDLSRCGVLAYRPRTWARLAAGDDEATLREAFRGLHASRHVVLDEDGDELFVRTYLRHDGLLTQPMVVAGVIRSFDAITSDVIRIGVLAELRRLWTVDLEPAERDGLRLLFGEPHPKPGVAKAIGRALADPLTDAIRKGHVEGFAEGHREGLPEGLAKGLREGTGQGQGRGYVTGPPGVPVPVPTPTPLPGPSKSGSSDGRTDELLDACGIVLGDVRTKLAPTIDEALAGGVAPTTIRVALVSWHNRGAMPGLLAHLIEEFHGKAGAAAGNGSTRPPWCGHCDEPTRMLLDDDHRPLRRCGECHPAEAQPHGRSGKPATPAGATS